MFAMSQSIIFDIIYACKELLMRSQADTVQDFQYRITNLILLRSKCL